MKETEESPSPSAPNAPEMPAIDTPETLETAPQPAAGDAPKLSVDEIENNVVEILKTVFDPEIPVNIYELGLVYDVDVQESGEVKISMTLTSPACPVAGSLPGEVQAKVEKVPGVTKAEIDLVWEPAWNPSMMSEASRLQLGMF
jgi:FeS assembly SUF system protein